MHEIKEKESLGDPVFSLSNKLIRVLWGVVYYSFFRLSPTPLFQFRTLILCCFGAKVGKGCAIYPSAKIWLPSNLTLGKGVALGPNVKIYNQGKITINDHAIISQGAHLCASTHDYNDSIHPIILTPISIGKHAWVCAEAFVGPGVMVAEGTVIGARAVMTRKSVPWSVYAGNPAIKVKDRKRFI